MADYIDTEMLEARNANEKEVYYFVNRGEEGCGTIVKKYKPSVAALFCKRCGCKMIRVDDVCREKGWKSHKPVERRPHRKFEDKEPGKGFVFHF